MFLGEIGLVEQESPHALVRRHVETVSQTIAVERLQLNYYSWTTTTNAAVLIVLAAVTATTITHSF